MRYYKKLGPLGVAYRMVWPIIFAIGLVRRGHPLWVALAVGLAALLLSVPTHLANYWEMFPDRLVRRRFWKRVEFPFSEIAHVGPVTGSLAEHSGTRDWMEIRTHDGLRVLVDVAEGATLLSELRPRLPQSPSGPVPQ